MTQNFRYQHIASSVEDKTPTSGDLYTNEVGLNNFAGKEKLFIKNTNDEIASFSSDSQLDGKFANKTIDLDGVKIKKISQSDYDALVASGTVDANTLYIIIN